jgi:mRNA interferase MazF
VKRGDRVTVAMAGDFGKPRPALVIQADTFVQTNAVTVLLLSSTQMDAPLIRLSVQPTPHNGLKRPSQVQIDKVHDGAAGESRAADRTAR